MDKHIAAIFGGTGFLGRRLVQALAAKGWHVRCVARHPPETHDDGIEPMAADVCRPETLKDAVADASLVVNAVSLYAETAETSFHDVHVDGAANLAEAANDASVQRLIQLSGIGADPAAWDAYIRARGEGERAVARARPDALILRPSVMIGPDDAFLTTHVDLVRRLPVLPLFGRGRTRLQPVAGDDVAAAIAALAAAERPPASPIELGGPDILTHRHVLSLIARRLGKRRLLLPIPFWAWQIIARLGERLPGQPITRHNVALMRNDNVAGQPERWGDWGIRPTSLAEVLDDMYGAGD